MDKKTIADTCPRRNVKPVNYSETSPSVPSHQNSGGHQCATCEKKYSRLDTLRAHERAAHTTDGAIECGGCSQKFMTQQALERHWPVHHKVKCFKCPSCPKSYTRDDTLRIHIRTVHLGKNSGFKCEQCGVVLGCKKSLKRHECSLHEDESTWPYHCSVNPGVCKDSFPRLDKLKEHENCLTHHKPNCGCVYCHKADCKCFFCKNF